LLERRADAQYATLLVLVWDPRTAVFNMANAGSVPPIICRQGTLIRPRAEGVPLGLLDAREYDEVPFQTRSGDLVVLYSDGVQDQPDPAGREYGRGPLAHLLKELWRRSPREIVQAILEDLDRFRDTAEVADDQTLIVMKVK
jgi:sigma-B regulation protein RsbU (phosphoserine phosphatase)